MKIGEKAGHVPDFSHFNRASVRLWRARSPMQISPSIHAPRGSKEAVKKQSKKSGGFQKRSPPQTFEIHIACGSLFAIKIDAPTTAPRNYGTSWCKISLYFKKSSGFVHSYLLQMVLVKVKTTGYQS